jgi:hypothetical protein
MAGGDTMDTKMTPLTGEQLQAARKAAAERFETIAMRHVPEGWMIETRKSLTGKCKYGSKTIAAPKPVTRKSLYIFLHECAHAQLHSPLYSESKSRYRAKPKHVIEMEAEKWAHEKMRANDVPVPRSMTTRAKQYVARKIRQAEKNGAKKIDAQARRYANGVTKWPT